MNEHGNQEEEDGRADAGPSSLHKALQCYPRRPCLLYRKPGSHPPGTMKDTTTVRLSARIILRVD